MADIRINPLEYPRPLQEQVQNTIPRTLNEIGDVFAAQKRREAIGQVLQGSPDIETAARRLGELGLIEEARPLFALAQQKAALAQSAGQHAAALAETKRFHDLTTGLQREQFTAQLEGQKVPPGFTRGPEGAITYVPGGPADPNYIAQTANAKVPTVSQYNDAELTLLARQLNAGDTSVLTNMSRGANANANLTALRKKATELNEAAQITPEQQAMKNAEFFGTKAGQRTIATRSANIELPAAEFEQMKPLALEASNAVDRSRYPNLNSVILAWERGTGDENVVRLAVGANTLANIYARAVSPTGVATDELRKKGNDLLNQAYSKGQFAAAVDFMGREIAAARASPANVQQHMRENFLKGQGPGAGGAPQQQGMSREDANQKIQAVRSIMQQRISGGADPAAELKAANDTLRRNGLPPLAGP